MQLNERYTGARCGERMKNFLCGGTPCLALSWSSMTDFPVGCCWYRERLLVSVSWSWIQKPCFSSLIVLFLSLLNPLSLTYVLTLAYTEHIILFFLILTGLVPFPFLRALPEPKYDVNSGVAWTWLPSPACSEMSKTSSPGILFAAGCSNIVDIKLRKFLSIPSFFDS